MYKILQHLPDTEVNKKLLTELQTFLKWNISLRLKQFHIHIHAHTYAHMYVNVDVLEKLCFCPK